MKLRKAIQVILYSFFTLTLISQQNTLLDNQFSKFSIQLHPTRVFQPLIQSESLFREDSKWSNSLKDGTALKIDRQNLDLLLKEKLNNLTLSIPSKSNESFVLELIPSPFKTDDFVIKTAQNTKEELDINGLYYWGKVKGKSGSFASISITKNEITGAINFDDKNYYISKSHQDEDDIHVLYESKDLLDKNTNQCFTDETFAVGQTIEEEIEGVTFRSLDSDNLVRMYVEVDYDVYLNKGSIQATANYIFGLFSQVSLLYANEAINLKIHELLIWNIADPYTGNSTIDYLTQFRSELNGNYNGDLAHLIGFKGGGGVAWLNQVCGSLGYGYSGINSSYNNLPQYSWSVEVVTHEIGHNLGSPHTHDCAWNGNNTAIDGCGPAAGYNSGCDTILPSKGTIMSYCHLVGGVGIDLSLGFGPQPGDLIRDKVYNGSCLSSEVPPLNYNIAISELSSNSSCSTTEFTPQIKLSNFGTSSISSCIFSYQIDGGSSIDVNWTGNLPSNSSAYYTLPSIILDPGSHEVNLAVSSPNGNTDQDLSDNSLSKTFVAGTVPITLTIIIDNYPQETTWDISDQDGNILFEGGPYSGASGSTIVENLCLIDGCFDLNFKDSFGDGICCTYGNGSYSLTDDATGSVLVSSNGDFGASESSNFCLPVTGSPLSVTLSKQDVSCGEIQDGLANAIALGGTGSYSYEWSNGETTSSINGLNAGIYSVTVSDGESNASASTEIFNNNQVFYVDNDGDGYGSNEEILDCEKPGGTSTNNLDCNDENASINPGAEEICDGIDNNCDGNIDEDVKTIFYVDSDNDGFGSNEQVLACEQPDGTSTNNQDCDDSNSSINPGADEICDGIDNNCDGNIDEGLTETTYYADSDGDGFGDPDDSVTGCSQPDGYVANDEDCDDGDSAVNPNAEEICDGIDNNCDGNIDEGLTETTYYADGDGDGFGDPDDSVTGCSQPEGYVANDEDCDDGDGSVNPDAIEICDGIDNNCDGNIDEDVKTIFYVDSDNDGFGSNEQVLACEQPDGTSTNNQDCDDSNSSINPGAQEICDGIDNNCDGNIDEGLTETTYYADSDGDGFGDPDDSVTGCSQPGGYVANDGDCDDEDSAVNPNAEEICDGIDNNCDGNIDEDVKTIFYVDSDNDGFGSNEQVLACEQPDGTSANNQDCDDSNSSINPGAQEICDGIDNNCDGNIDEGLTETTYYADSDGDGFGDPDDSVTGCSQPDGYVANDEDCDDGDSAVNPNAEEICDGIDNNCDGNIDEGLTETTYYADGDGDGFGDPDDSVTGCSQPEGYVANDEDCDDGDSSVNPDAIEICDGIDNNCDGNIDEDVKTIFYVDSDNDGFGSNEQVLACEQPDGTSTNNQDCDDSNSSINPGAQEICDGIDNNCDGNIDEELAETTYYADSDNDGFGDPDDSITDCSQPAGYVANDGDCDDGDSAVNPNAEEICDEVDNNCDGNIDEDLPQTTYYEDRDGDGYGNPEVSVTTCSQPESIVESIPLEGYVTNSEDCDDENANINPGAEEICDGIDNNCDGNIDEDVKTIFYVDNDGDGYGSNEQVLDCEIPEGASTNNLDCDDANPNINPGAEEICDGIDNNCDGEIDEGVKTIFYVDNDGDGYGSNEEILDCEKPEGASTNNLDCDDENASINPEAEEICDGIDNNCDGNIDEGITETTYYADGDGDGFGDPDDSVTGCSQPDGYVANDEDCDDGDGSVNPDAIEICDGIDNNCDGNIDEDVKTIFYVDNDGDGYGSNEQVLDCEKPEGASTNNLDCNDANPNINPGAEEICDGIDNNCDGNIDEGVTETTYYADSDGDGFGDPENSITDCSQPNGYVTNDGDCDDGDSAVNPNAEEICDDVDNNCDGEIDEGVKTIFYVDNDGDGYGSNEEILDCEKPEGASTNNLDCDDANPNINPGAEEICDGIDNNCDGNIDEGLTETTYYADGDGDGFGDPDDSVTGCSQPEGYVANDEDCDDGEAAINPDATEICDGIDNNCDGEIDEGVKTIFYVDNDGDGYGSNEEILDCEKPEGASTNNLDCNDNNANIYPGAEEICDGIDNNCDGNIDEGIAETTYYADSDGDGFGDPEKPVTGCSQPAGYVANDGDCDDGDSAVNPNAEEICDEVDNNCDGNIDEDLPQTTYYEDRDGDGYGNPEVSVTTCSQPESIVESIPLEGYVTNSEDCDDENANINPGAEEICDGIDNNCDGNIDEDVKTIFYVDNDGDGYGSNEQVLDCEIPEGASTNNLDCDDANPNINPGAEEICDGIDNNCDGEIDEGVKTIFYVDNDGDGYGSNEEILDCEKPEGASTNNLDCDDENASINPEAEEICDGIDNNCDGNIDEGITETTYYADGDGDGFGDPDDSVTGCSQPDGYVANDEDCDDGDGSVNPDAIEICDGIDNNCDGNIDEDVKTIFYVDNDGDGYGSNEQVLDCEKPEGASTNNLDCNDANPNINPGAEEICDGIDNNCDGNIDEDVKTIFYVDNDGDGYGSNEQVLDCEIPEGASTNNLDCDDANPNINPGAEEICDGIDNNCDGEIDEGVKTIFYVDNDGDGYGSNEEILDCEKPEGASTNNLDCDDENASINPEAEEICDGIDNNCDGNIDEGITETTYYADGDGDGFGDPDDSVTGCSQPDGYVANDEDCDDGDGSVNPDAIEICDGIDNNCDGNIDEDVKTIFYVDNDGDGYGSNEQVLDCEKPEGASTNNLDCNDANPNINPGAEEICDGIDNNCDGNIDEELAETTYYADSDNDGFGDPDDSITDCSQPAGYVANDGDCDDGDSAVNPNAEEICDEVDNNCDGNIDEDLPQTTYYEDRDGDGYGNPEVSVTTCSQPESIVESIPLEGYVTNSEDCDDENANINPGAEEICDGIDNNCDGNIDEDVKTIFYVDNDGDGYGSNEQVLDCEIPEGASTNNLDCDDANPNINPGAEEICDGIDNNCDGEIDEGVKTIFYVDNDGDGYGSNEEILDCEKPEGASTNNLDCDDENASINPEAEEICDGIDNNCDGNIDEGITETTYYADGDGDGFGDPDDSVTGCSQPDGYVANDEDCDDGDGSVNPDAIEICDGIDNNCDGNIDEDVKTIFYVDNDGDGYGSNEQVLDCEKPEGASTNNLDCDDANPNINPGAEEICDGIDNNCDGEIDEGVKTIFYVDNDGDGYGSNEEILDCEKPEGASTNNLDCDDENASINPEAEEICDGIDNNCDGNIDEGITETTYYADSDGDGFGDPDNSVTGCSQPDGYVANDEDCDDGDGSVNPDAIEICDGIDNNCDGNIDEDVKTIFYVDNDGDGYGSNEQVLDCEKPEGASTNNLDCNDANPNINPGAEEICDGIDNNCDGNIDEGVTETTYYADSDGDGFGDPENSITDCSQPNGYVTNDGDCDDGDSAVNPNAEEICDDVDNNCDGEIDEGVKTIFYVDNDGDGYGSNEEILDCEKPEGASTNNLDCDDANPNINPGAEEICDGIDNNCDGNIDEGLTETTYYADSDGDGFGDPDNSVTGCSQPDGYVNNDEDCDDGEAAINPDATEICDGIDNNCDGEIDEGVKTIFYVDNDGDGYGSNEEILACEKPEGASTNNLDCNDSDATIYPLAPCNDGKECTINDFYDEECNCIGTFIDSDEDGVCDAEDDCPGGDDNIDENENGVPDDCEECQFTEKVNFDPKNLKHTGLDSSRIDLDLEDGASNISFSITKINSKLTGKESKQYIEKVIVYYFNINDEKIKFGNFTAREGEEYNVSIPGLVKKIRVVLRNVFDSEDAKLSVNLGEVTFCTSEANDVIEQDFKISPIISEKSISESGEEVNIFPNPAKDFLTLEIANELESNIKIISMDGRTLIDKDFDSRRVILNISSIKESGFYLLRVINGNNAIQVKKILIIK